MVVKQFGWGVGVESLPRIGYVITALRFLANFRFDYRLHRTTHNRQIVWVLYGQASRAISIG